MRITKVTHALIVCQGNGRIGFWWVGGVLCATSLRLQGVDVPIYFTTVAHIQACLLLHRWLRVIAHVGTKLVQ